MAKEDQSRLREGHAATNFSLIRRAALSLLKNDRSQKLGVKNKPFNAAWDDESREFWGASPFRSGSRALTYAERASPPEQQCDISKLANPVTFLSWSDTRGRRIDALIDRLQTPASFWQGSAVWIG